MILLTLVIGLSSSCAPQLIQQPPIPLPARPVLEQCPIDPGVQGVVTNRQTIEIPVQDAIKLKQYINGLISCEKINVLLLNGHIEKLENRIKAVTHD